MATQTTIRPQFAEINIGKWVTRYLPTATRVLMGLIFFVFGLNGFLNFLPQTSRAMPPAAVAFGGALMSTGYMLPLLKSIEVLVGISFLSNRFVPLALAVIAPVVVNIFAFHAFLAPSGLVLAGVLVALELYLAWSYRKVYRPMLSTRVVLGTDPRE